MAGRHAWAIQALQTNNLFDLCDLLKAACEESMKENVSPYQDAACRLICRQIAFAGNGDILFLQYYQDVVDYCSLQVQRAQAGLPEKTDGKKPTYQAS